MIFGFNSLVFFEEEKFENVKSDWSLTKVNEWPWPWVVINHHVIIYLTICTNFHLTDFNSFSEIYSLSIFPYKSKRDQIWHCCKKGQGQPRIIIWIYLVVLQKPMPLTKFQCHRLFGSREENFQRFLPYMSMAAILVMWHKPFSSIPWRLHMKFSFNQPSGY